jgi:glucose-1-phosphate cytidylyltransferase
MKVVLFCGGLGMRMRNGVDAPVPKPMMPIGTRPVLWHIMRYYAHFGHNEFILCLGFGAHAVKDYFLNYHETHSNDFVLSNAGRTVELLSSDISAIGVSPLLTPGSKRRLVNGSDAFVITSVMMRCS